MPNADLENWKFPCVGAWDGFHVYVSTRLKIFIVLKKIPDDKHGSDWLQQTFLRAAVGALGSTYDARVLHTSKIYSDNENGLVLPQASLNLHPHGSFPFITVGNSTFPSQWRLLKPYKEGTTGSSKKEFQSTHLLSTGLF